MDYTFSNNYEEYKGRGPLPAGSYKVEIIKCEHKQSKSGRMMYALKLQEVETHRHINDWIITDPSFLREHPKAEQKLGSLLKSAKLLEVNKGTTVSLPAADMFLGKEVTAVVLVDREDPERNTIFRYLTDIPEKKKDYRAEALRSYHETIDKAKTEKPMVSEDVPF